MLRGATTSELRKEAMRMGMSTLRQDALKKFLKGVIDIDEVVRVTTGD